MSILNNNAFGVMLQESAEDFIFGLDMQFLFDALIFAVAMLVLAAFLSYVLFNPARELLKKRQDGINNNLEQAQKEKTDAQELKAEYEAKLVNVQNEADEILSETRKKALKKENEIVNEAKAEAQRIIVRANKEAELEKSRMQDDIKKEIIVVASAMAGKIVTDSMNDAKHNELVNETLKEIGDGTWQK